MNRAKSIAEAVMKRKKGQEIEAAPIPNEQDFLSDEQDDSKMLANNEDFLSADMDDAKEQVDTLPKGTPDEDNLVVSIMERMKFDKMRKRSA